MTEINQNVLETFVKSFSCEKISAQDVEDFAQRVFSFIDGQKWISRPLILSPSICARFGWKCVNPNLLECVACGAKLCTQEPKIEIYDAYKSCLNKIVSDLKDGHKTHCPWPLAPSPESFVKMVPLPKEEALSQFAARLKPCLDFKHSIPQVKDSIPSKLSLKEADVLSLYTLAEVLPEDANPIGMSIVCLAATGWTLISKSNGEKRIYVKCDCCQRLIWVKSFNLIDALSTGVAPSIENGTNFRESSPIAENARNSEKEASNSENGTDCGKETSPNVENGSNSEKESSGKRNLDHDTSCEGPRKRLKLERKDFDPLEEHRPWCRWVSMTDVKDRSPLKDDDLKENPVPGWKLYMKCLLKNILSSPDKSFESTPSKEHVRSVRNLLESWTSPSSL